MGICLDIFINPTICNTETVSIPDTGISLEPYEYIESPVSDGTIDENFEEELPVPAEVYCQVNLSIIIIRFYEIKSAFVLQVGDEPSSIIIHEAEGFADGDKFAELDRKRLVNIVGDDVEGKRIIIVSACNLPNNTELHPDELLR